MFLRVRTYMNICLNKNISKKKTSTKQIEKSRPDIIKNMEKKYAENGERGMKKRKSKPKLDISGKTFGKLLAVKEAPSLKNRTYWLCVCECGKEKVSLLCSLRSGKTRSCGCNYSTANIKDKTGNRSGKLLFIDEAFIKNKRVYWNCICDCGKKTVVCSGQFPKSCGCLSRISRAEKKIGKVLGKLKILSYRLIDNQTLWTCSCECGKTIEIKHLKGKSCGCTKGCRGERHYLWRNDLTAEIRVTERNKIGNPSYHKWIKQIFLRDNYTCQLSGQKGIKISAHHLDAWASYPNKRFEIENGITVSYELHKLFHKLYGKGKNTKEQFLDFSNRYKNGEFE